MFRRKQRIWKKSLENRRRWDCNVSTRTTLLRKISKKRALISKNLRIFDQFSTNHETYFAICCVLILTLYQVSIQFLSIIRSIIMIEEYRTKTHRRVCHYKIRFKNIFMMCFFSHKVKKNDDSMHAKYNIKKTSKKLTRHLLIILLKKERISMKL
jgi:hypothetical protein